MTPLALVVVAVDVVLAPSCLWSMIDWLVGFIVCSFATLLLRPRHWTAGSVGVARQHSYPSGQH